MGEGVAPSEPIGAEPRGEQIVRHRIEIAGPRISSDTTTLSGGVAFGAALAGGAIAGPMCAFIALPAAAWITSFISNWVKHYEVVYKSQGEGADIA
jgi:predicted PurR-regulated permease PerM